MATTNDGYVQVAPDSTGKKVDVSELTNLAGDVVERQRISQADPTFVNNLTKTTSEGELYVGGPVLEEILVNILIELRVHTAYLQEIAGPRMNDDPNRMRADAAMII